MRSGLSLLIGGLTLVTMLPALSQDARLTFPKNIETGGAISIQSTGSGDATLTIVGLGQVLKRDVHLGDTTLLPAGSLLDAGHYIAVLAQGSSTSSWAFDVVPANEPASIAFLAKPSRLQVGTHNGISGAAYVFDAYHNLIVSPARVLFELSNPSGDTKKSIVPTRYGAAWTEMDSTPQQGVDVFVAQAGEVSSTRIIKQVPGDPCSLKMKASKSGSSVELETEPVRDCSGNAAPDGTIVTFTETYSRGLSTADVPLKHGVAKVEMPAHSGATLSVASGVVLGNQIRLEN